MIMITQEKQFVKPNNVVIQKFMEKFINQAKKNETYH